MRNDPNKRWVRTDIKTGEREYIDRLLVVQHVSVAYRVSPQEARQALLLVEDGLDGDVRTLRSIYTYEAGQL